MFGTGLPEIVIILLVVLLLFGPAAVTFWLGYTMGQSKAADSQQTEQAHKEPDGDAGKGSADE
jgi:Sec-independent protein translocase protein TatA